MNKIVRMALPGLALLMNLSLLQASDVVDREVRYLLHFVGDSECTFLRNGSEFNSQDARRHLQRKYRYFQNRLHSAEDFINKAASRSSMSGTAYEVRCGDSKMVSKQWLTRELHRHRQVSSSGKDAGGDT